MRFINLSLFLVSSFLFLPQAMAHGGQPSLEKEVDGYLVDIGMSTIGIRPGEDVTFDFDLFTGTGGALSFAPFSEVKMSIFQGEQLYIGTTILNDGINVPRAIVSFKNPGAFSLQVDYMQNETLLARADFPLHVSEVSGAVGRTVTTVTYWMAGILALFSLGIIITKLRSR